MDDILLIDATERLKNGEMSAQEKLYLEEMRKNNPELDQTVVEHLFFLNQLDTFRNTKDFKHNLAEVQNTLVEEGLIKRKEMPLKAKVVNMWAKYKRIVAVAASIAGLVSIFIASLVSAVSTNKNQNITHLVQVINETKEKVRQTENKVNRLQENVAKSASSTPDKTPFVDAKFRATGFMIDAANNYIATNAHVISQAKNHLVIEDNNGKQYLAKPVYINDNDDLAIIQVTDSAFERLPLMPYTIRRSNAELGEPVFMLGYPKPEIVYDEGYVSAKNGYQMDTIYCQLSTTANAGSSGSPVITKNGDLVGIITSKETNTQGVVYAIKSVNIYRAIDEVKKLEDHGKIKIASRSSLKGLDRVSQIKKMEDYVFMVKGN